MYDLLVQGGTIVSGQGRRKMDLAVIGGKISAVLEPDGDYSASRVVDARGLFIFPGLIDTHVHLRDPARPDRETFETGTSAAAAGGVTTILEMPTSDPPVNTAQRLKERVRVVAPRALVDFALYGGAGAENLAEIPLMADAGAIGFKTWLHAPAKGRETEFVGLSCTGPEDQRVVIATVAKTGLRHALHAEDQVVLDEAAAHIKGMVAEPGLIHAASRPTAAEDSAVAMILQVARETRARVQIVHITSPNAIRQLAKARSEGVDATAEVAPHYLALDEQTLKTYGAFAKCNPPLRPDSIREEIWHLLQQGQVDVVGSDHCAFLESELESGLSDISTSPAGLPGLETMLPIMLSAAHNGRLGLEDVVRLTSQRAAELFGLSMKGRLDPGFDADFVVIDTEENWTYDSSRSFSKAGANARFFEGVTFNGRVRETWVRGVQVYDGQNITGQPGHGKFLIPGTRSAIPAS